MIDKVIQTAENEVGYLEKRSLSQLRDKTANAGSGNYTKYWQDIKPDYQGQPWCACFVTWVLVTALGAAEASRLLKHYPFVYCPTLASLHELHKQPKKGAIVLFYRGGTWAHTGIVIDTDGSRFTTIEGNTSGGNTVVPNGGGVYRKTYTLAQMGETRFVYPDYKEGGLTMTEYNELKAEIASNKAKTDSVISLMGKEIDELKKGIERLTAPMIYNYVDENMPEWYKEAVQWCMDRGIIKGTGEGLGLTDERLATCQMLYNYDKGIDKG